MKRLMVVGMCIVGLMLCSCSDARRAKIKAVGNAHVIELYSGGELVRTFQTDGKPQSEENSDGYYFMNSETSQLQEVSGTVVITCLDD